MQLFLSSHSLLIWHKQALSFHYPSGRKKKEWVDFTAFEATNSNIFMYYTRLPNEEKFCVCPPQPHKTMGLGQANGVRGESQELQ